VNAAPGPASPLAVETWSDARPGEGRVFAAVFPHADDLAIFAGGTVLKLLHEGYTGYFIKTTNDDKDSYDLSAAETAHRNDAETRQVVEYLGLRKLYCFDYQNHYLGAAESIELRHRLITLFRHLRVDTVLSYDPWGHYEENPDHVVTAQAVEAACWMAGRRRDLPELEDLGLLPLTVRDKYYVARGPQLTNLVVDITPAAERKRRAVAMHRTPMDNMWRTHLELHPDDPIGLDEFVATRVIDDRGEEYGFGNVELFHRIGADG
jgi:LmbE family N-acetylglucosaminyl deacetylase